MATTRKRTFGAETRAFGLPCCFRRDVTTSAHTYTGSAIQRLDPDTLFDEFQKRGVSFVKELSFIDQGLWGFEVADADGYVLAFFQVRNGLGERGASQAHDHHDDG